MASVEKRGNTYRIRVALGYDMNLNPIRRSKTWTPPLGMTQKQEKKELERQVVLFEEQCRNGQFLSPNITFAEFAEKWFSNYAEKQLRPTTIAGYRRLLKRILPVLGHIRLEKLQPYHIIEFYNKLAEKGAHQIVRYQISPNISQILKAKHITQNELAVQSSICACQISKIINGNLVYHKNASKIADAIGMPFQKVFQPVLKNDGRLSGNTLQHYHRLLSTILSTAVKWQVIVNNPCERVDPPKIVRKEAQYLDADQAGKLLEALQTAPEQYRVMVTTLLYTGIRRGELCGLEWKDIDFEKGLLSIQRSSLFLPHRGVFTDETKTTTSHRVLKIADSLLRMLKEYHINQQKMRLQLGDQWHECGRLFTAWNGLPIHPDTFSQWFSHFIKENNLPQISVHSLRHTNATLLISAGVNLKTVSAHLGHATVSITGNIYAHSIQSAEAAASQALEAIFEKKTTKQA